MSQEKTNKPWGGRFAAATDKLMEEFSQSVHFDWQLYPFDILGSKAHARMLAKAGLIEAGEAEQIVSGLDQIKAEIEAGEFKWNPALEDVHMNIERALSERIGEAGGKLHTARSRNDQVALDTRLYVKQAVLTAREGIRALRLALVNQGLANPEAVMPGYTHLQRAQNVLAAHHLLAYCEMLKRDDGRFADLMKRVDIMPLGSAALAGTDLPIDMEFTAAELGFGQITANSMDSVAARDYLLEFVSAAAILMTHLSRLSEDLILWASSEFDFVDLPDELCTGSSIMPQKKNPDVPELVRGKSGRVIGDLMALFTVVKGLPLAYNRDLQEDKEPLFDTVNTLSLVLPLMARLVARMRLKTENMSRAASEDPFVAATDLADHLVTQGLPFRQAHEQVGRLVRHLIENGRGLAQLSQDELAEFCPLAEAAILNRLDAEATVRARTSIGGTAPKNVRAQLASCLAELEKE